MTLKYLRDHGAVAVVVERYNHFARRRQDVFGADIQAVWRGRLIGIQSTSGSNHASRVQKAINSTEVLAWLSTGNSFQVWSWTKRFNLWTHRVTAFNLMNSEIVREEM